MPSTSGNVTPGDKPYCVNDSERFSPQARTRMTPTHLEGAQLQASAARNLGAQLRLPSADVRQRFPEQMHFAFPENVDEDLADHFANIGVVLRAFGPVLAAD